ncbi:MAG TPA: glucokinase [Chitinophagaceae bacterium]|nr:glucokinase [Chitinophagaceae bacterium]
MTKELVLGIDIGGTNTVWGIVDARGHILSTDKISTKGHLNPETFMQALYINVNTKAPAELIPQITGIGIGAPNGNYYSGCIEFAPNLEWKGVIPLKDLSEKHFKIKTRITNDANAAALGEMQYGAARGMKDFIMVTLGTGVGSGFVANGALIYGHDGLAGELGHVIAVRNGRACGCGRKGCLETYTSATGVVRTAQELLENYPGKSLLQDVPLSSKEIAFAAEKGDELSIRIFDFTAQILGQSLADAVAITSPSAIIFFGGLSQSGELLMKPLKNYFEENLLSIYRNKVQILSSQLPESDAAVLGAAGLAWN